VHSETRSVLGPPEAAPVKQCAQLAQARLDHSGNRRLQINFGNSAPCAGPGPHNGGRSRRYAKRDWLAPYREWLAQTRECRRRTPGTCARLEALQTLHAQSHKAPTSGDRAGHMHLRRFCPFAGRASGLARKRSSRWTGSEFGPIAGEVRQGNGLQPSRGRVYPTGNRDG
jgi:hypothetical protein